jgi:hypothetical protein
VDDGTGKSTDDIQLAATPLMVICLPSWTRALTCSTLSAAHEVPKQPTQSSMTLFLPLWNLSTHWYTLHPLHNIVFSLC